MDIRTIYFNDQKTVYMRAYLSDSIEYVRWSKCRPAVLILPGGGYERLSDREAEPIALHYLAAGYNVFVLYYSVNQHFPVAFCDAARALYEIRSRSDEFGINKNKVAVWGASSGGHLAGCLATMWNDLEILDKFGYVSSDVRPDAVVLSYPVVSGVVAAHKDSFVALLGRNASDSDLFQLSIENRVSSETPPVFIWCTANDGCVSARNSLIMANACVVNKVPVELHMFDKGIHGLSTCDKVTAVDDRYCLDDCKIWIDLSIKFLNKYLQV